MFQNSSGQGEEEKQIKPQNREGEETNKTPKQTTTETNKTCLGIFMFCMDLVLHLSGKTRFNNKQDIYFVR